MQVVETAHQTLEIADAVAVGIHIGSDVCKGKKYHIAQNRRDR
jgi:hypothetical protein